MPASQQPVYWTTEGAAGMRIGRLSFLANGVVDVDAAFVASTGAGELPWHLTPLQAQGFLGRLLAKRLSVQGVDAKPERWRIEAVLLAPLPSPMR